jgi:hypothetical protein
LFLSSLPTAASTNTIPSSSSSSFCPSGLAALSPSHLFVSGVGLSSVWSRRFPHSLISSLSLFTFPSLLCQFEFGLESRQRCETNQHVQAELPDFAAFNVEEFVSLDAVGRPARHRAEHDPLNARCGSDAAEDRWALLRNRTDDKPSARRSGLEQRVAAHYIKFFSAALRDVRTQRRADNSTSSQPPSAPPPWLPPVALLPLPPLDCGATLTVTDCGFVA